MKPTHLSLLAALLLISACSAAETQTVQTDDDSATESAVAAASEDQTPDIDHVELQTGFYMLTGPGGNIGVSIGDDGVFVIDDKFARFGEQIIAEIATLTDAPIEFVINTHYHGDHTGANAVMKDVGATVVAHDNVRARMGSTFENVVFGRTTEATDPSLWPTLTFSETATFHFNDQTVNVIHTPTAHTDGDSIIFFEQANIIHMGDNYFNGLFPFIDVSGGGTIDGMIASHNRALELANMQTQIIPGHGPMATKADLTDARDMLITIRDRVKTAMNEGQSLDDILAAKLISDYAKFSSFIDEDNMVRTAFYSLGGPLPSTE